MPKDIELKTNFAPDIPDVLYGDSGKVKQVITNILTNAAKYTEQGEIIFTVSCINNKENKFLSQDLKNQDVVSKINDKIAKGVSKIKILIITYLKEYVNTKFSKEIVREDFIRPSNEKTSREEVLTEIVLFISSINSEKQMFLLNRFSPILLIARVILENMSRSSSMKK